MLARSLLVTTVLVAALGSASGQTGFSDHCANGSALPFASIEVKHPLDSTCGIQGKSTSPAPSQRQNSVKNNFCGDSSTPEVFTPKMLTDLQAKTHVAAGQGKEPADRTALTELGEGKIIKMKAHLIEAHHADVGAGESVNCNGPTEEDNDIHIAFGALPNSKECKSVSAEISPHFRPATWNEIGNFEKFNPTTKLNVVDKALASRLQAHPYRITGQLFFDASHAPCPCGTKCNPIRSSDWEIHPIYNIEVCKAGTSCNENTDSDWMPFDTWWSTLTPVQPTKPPHSHQSHEPKPKKAGTTTTHTKKTPG
jgi:hypothetical protein